MNEDLERQVKIKCGVLKRCLKEYHMYQTEVSTTRHKAHSTKCVHIGERRATKATSNWSRA